MSDGRVATRGAQRALAVAPRGRRADPPRHSATPTRAASPAPRAEAADAAASTPAPAAQKRSGARSLQTQTRGRGPAKEANEAKTAPAGRGHGAGGKASGAKAGGEDAGVSARPAATGKNAPKTAAPLKAEPAVADALQPTPHRGRALMHGRSTRAQSTETHRALKADGGDGGAAQKTRKRGRGDGATAAAKAARARAASENAARVIGPSAPSQQPPDVARPLLLREAVATPEKAAASAPSTRRCPPALAETLLRVRRWNGLLEAYGAWEEIMPARGAKHIFNLRRGGAVIVLRDFVRAEEREEMVFELESCALFRQYKFGNVPEPRVHMLLSASPAVGYKYHGVTMRAQSISSVGTVERLALRSSQMFESIEWNIGVDVVCYRNGFDSCGWHSDDTQGEQLVLCAVVENSGGGLRRVCFRPKVPPHAVSAKKRRATAHAGEAALENGDEELELFLRAGDAYSTDGLVQVGYEHAVPKALADVSGRRIVAIMRAGADCVLAATHADTGEATSLSPPEKGFCGFGHVPGVPEAVDSKGHIDQQRQFSREWLFKTGAHTSSQRGVSGSVEAGAQSVVVSRQSAHLNEVDHGIWLRYTSSRRQGAGALCRNYVLGDCVRVFRSSGLANKWAPTKCEDFDAASSYRYDGLYRVSRMWDDGGSARYAVDDADESAVGHERVYTFQLERVDGNVLNAATGAVPDEGAAGAVAREAGRVASEASRDGPPIPAACPAPPSFSGAVRFLSACMANSCSNAAWAAALGFQPFAVESPATLPVIVEREDCMESLTRSKLAAEGRNACERALAEVVSLVAAEDAVWFEDFPRWPVCRDCGKFAEWLVHRKLLWRRDKLRVSKDAAGGSHADGEAHGSQSSTGCGPAPRRKRNWAGALAATTDDVLLFAIAKASEQANPTPPVQKLPDVRLESSDPRRGAVCPCALCARQEGGAEGPLEAFVDGTEASAKVFWVHEKCASASSEVYFDDAGGIYGVLDACKRGRQIKCHLSPCLGGTRKCGATVGCGDARCRKSYHYTCALATGWRFGAAQSFFCQTHRHGLDHDPLDAQVEDSWLFDCPCGVRGKDYDDGAQMWECGVCETWQHAACAASSNAESLDLPEGYACNACNACRESALEAAA